MENKETNHHNKKEEKRMPVAMRKLPKISERDIARISDIIKTNNKKLEERRKRIRAKLYSEHDKH